MSNIVGIDLGTTFSCIAVLDAAGKPEIVPNADGDRITPSVVFASEDEAGTLSVGEEARNDLMSNPSRGIEEIKRKMGDKDYTLEVDSVSHSPQMISSVILKKLIQDAEKEKGPIESAVVTVPANFEDAARDATMDAGRLAGIEVSHIINEPTAAALYYATHNTVAGNLLIYDLGGGTFDATVASVKNKEVEVIASQGDRNLGGKDFDRAIFEWMRQAYLDQHGVDLVSEDQPEGEWMKQAETIKKGLSKKDRVKVILRGEDGNLKLELTRPDFEEMISTKVARTESLMEIVLDEAGMEPQDIDSVLLVGGSSRIPVFQESIRKLFGKEPEQSVNVDEVVALGAAIYAGKKAPEGSLSVSQERAMSAVQMTDVCNHFFGTLVARASALGGHETYNEIIIRKNTPLPCTHSKSFYTVRDGQDAVDCDVTQSTSDEDDPKFVNIIWNGELNLPPNRPAGQEIKITYSYDENQIMHVYFEDVQSGTVLEADIRPERSGKVQEQKATLSDFVVE